MKKENIKLCTIQLIRMAVMNTSPQQQKVRMYEEFNKNKKNKNEN